MFKDLPSTLPEDLKKDGEVEGLYTAGTKTHTMCVFRRPKKPHHATIITIFHHTDR